jgi:hypothetical protein
MDEETLSALALAQAVELLRLALAALNLVNLHEPMTLRRMKELQRNCEDLEIWTAALLRHADVSWGIMASELDVARQSLHRRLNNKIIDYMVSPKFTEGRGLYSEWERLIPLLSTAVEELGSVDPRTESERLALRLRR